MHCRFCRFEFSLEEFPLACPACGDEIPDFDLKEETFSLVHTPERRLEVVEGFIPESVFFGSFQECFDLMEALEVQI